LICVNQPRSETRHAHNAADSRKKAETHIDIERKNAMSERQPFERMLVILGLAYTLLGVATAEAQGLTQAWTQATPMSPQDRAIIQSTTDSQVHGKPPHTVAKWANPDGGHSGTITLLSKSARQGMPCERIEYRIMEPRSERQHGRYVFTSCKLPDGSWKFAE
jgi:surface antigen